MVSPVVTGGAAAEEISTSSSTSSGVTVNRSAVERIRRGDQGEVELAAGEFVEQPARPLLREVQFDGRMLRVERAEHLRDEADAQRGRRAEPHPAALESGELGELATHRLGVGEHAAGQRQQRFPRDGQGAAAARAVKQLGAEIVFERRDLTAQRRLREVQLLGGAGEVAEAATSTKLRSCSKFISIAYAHRHYAKDALE